MTFKTAPNFEAPADAGADNVYNITVTASDGTLSSAAQPVAITVTNVKGPSVTSGATASFAENASGTVYTATGTDPENNALTWVLGGADAARFDINTNTGVVTFKTAPNFEAPADAGADNVYNITVTASDGTLSSAAQPVAITVTNVNEGPSVTSGATASFAENASGTVYTATGTDPENNALTWVLGGADAARFDINTNTGVVTFKTAPNFEAPADAGADNVYNITVTASDGTLSSAAQPVAITVTNVNEGPSVTSGATASFAENGSGTVYTATGTDPENSALTWALGGADAARFDINTNTGVVTFKTAPNFEAPADVGADNVYNITVTASDGTLSSAAQPVAITVTNVNEGPSVTSGATASFAENGSGTVYTATGTDPENSALTWALGGADAARFDINTNTGVVTFKTAPNFEAPADAGADNVYNITVTASDGSNSSAAQAVAITVTNVNEGPSVTSGATASFAENASGTVYTATGTDPENSALTWVLGGADAARFDINTNTGVVTFKTAPNFEAPADAGADNVYNITVTASDGTLSSAAQPVAITVTNVNEGPSVTSGATASFAENASGTVYTATGTDPESNALTWVLGGADAARFDINANTGVVTFKTAPNFEAPADAGADNVYNITVTASDGSNSSAAQPVAITVTNVNEGPTVTSGATANFAENGLGIVYTATGTDPDAGTSLTWALGGTDAGLFNINAASGAVTFKAAPNFDAPADAGANNVYDITVTASDGSLFSTPRAVAITVTNANEDIFVGPMALRSDGFGAGGSAGGWTSADRFPRQLADVNGDGRADIVGFGDAGVWVALADGSGGFGQMALRFDGFGAGASAGGWASDDRFPRQLADVNGDGRADIVGFGDAGVWVALADGSGGFDPMALRFNGFGAGASAGGWASDDRFPRQLADVNGDGRADIVGFGDAGVWVALADGSGGFDPMALRFNGFGAGASAGGWASDDRFPRQLADVNGDGRADIVGFGDAGVWVALADGSGGFDPMALRFNGFGAGASAGGWTSDDRFPRQLADMNGDGRADIVGFGEAGVWVALADGSGGFDPMALRSDGFGAGGSAGGWTSADRFPRQLADVNGDGRADIVGFGEAGVWVALVDNIWI
ncbi:VCBS domain-containing protein [Sediminicoccus sp. BL-A-41-H5]|uniref:VCBS domain-containing protein n=1 Tax=Sediminicoccus sp. BL-A-41-H5 TaxID=3421106 RepID=UPI003D66DD02